MFSGIKDATQPKETEKYRIFRQERTYKLADINFVLQMRRVGSGRLNKFA